MAHVGIVQIVGPHHVRLVPDGVTFVVARVVKVQIDFLLHGGVGQSAGNAVEPRLSCRGQTGKDQQ